MKKIIVVGTTGSGKSTLCNKLQKKLGIPYIQLDQLFWKANWQISSDEELFNKIKAAIEGKESWIIDGNYNRSNHLTWPKADTIIWIDFPFWLTFYQNLSRALKRWITREELWPNTNNRESLKRLFSKDSIIKWLIQTYPIMKERYQQAQGAPENSHLKFIHLKSRKAVRQFLQSV